MLFFFGPSRLKSSDAQLVLICHHCGQEMSLSKAIQEDGYNFCCLGCCVVWNLLSNPAPTIPQSKKDLPLSWLDSPEYAQDYVEQNADGTRTAYFYVEGLDCHSCFWTLEKIPAILPEIAEAKVDIVSSVVTIVLNPQGNFKRALVLFESMGHRVHPLQNFRSVQELVLKERRSDIIRIGVAGACAGNAMVYSVASYAGAEGHFLSIFHIYSSLFALPVLTYCALGFYKKAVGAIRSRTFNMDFSIALALVFGGIYGLYMSLVQGRVSYLDTLSMLVFLMLLSRFALKSALKKGEITNYFGQFFRQNSVKRVDAINTQRASDAYSLIPAANLKKDDLILVDRNEILAGDGEVLKGETYINQAALSGESEVQFKCQGSEVFAGTLNEGAPIVMRVNVPFDQSRIGKMLQTLEKNLLVQTSFGKTSDLMAKYLFYAVLFVGACNLLWQYMFHGDLLSGAETFITLLIISCPCALGLATPLVYHRSLAMAAGEGILIKDAAALEMAASVRNVFFDKTGTLTATGLEIRDLQGSILHSKPDLQTLHDIESLSLHPVAQAVCRYLELHHHAIVPTTNEENVKTIVLKTIPKIGLNARVGEDHWHIVKGESLEHEIWKNQTLIGRFILDEKMAQGTRQMLQALSRRNLKLHILSGDQEKRVQMLAKTPGLNFASVHGNVTPEKKAKIIQDYSQAAMVGDGANDIIALGARNVLGISVHRGMPAAISASRVWLQQDNLEALTTFFELAQKTRRLLYRNIMLSLSYNVLFIILTLMGIISPLIAAIVMPISALSITASVYVFPSLQTQNPKPQTTEAFA